MSNKKSDDQPKKVVRQSSAYERRVGEVLIEVVNTKQRGNDVPKSYHGKKWVVVARTPTKSGSIRSTKIGACDKKYDAIDVLLKHEIALKAALKEKDDN